MNKLALIVAVMIGLGSLCAEAQTSTIPIVVAGVGYDPQSEQVEVTLANTSDEMITAWFVAANLVLPDNSIVALGGFGTDAYLSAAGIQAGAHIPPHGQITYSRYRLSRTRVADGVLQVVPTAVITASGASIGDSDSTAAVFNDRERERQTWEVVVGIIKEAADSPNQSEGARGALARLSGLPTERLSPMVLQIVRQDLNVALTSGRRGQVQDILDRVTHRLQAASAASRRQQQR